MNEDTIEQNYYKDQNFLDRNSLRTRCKITGDVCDCSHPCTQCNQPIITAIEAFTVQDKSIVL